MLTWIEQLMATTKEMESPTSFWYWSALASISAVMKDSVWLSRGGAYKLYPNIYVMLLAGSAMKKGPPIGLAKEIVKLVGNTKVIVGRSSIQGILKELGTIQSSPNGKVDKKSAGFIVASEFSSSLVEDPAAFNCLTDLYDRHYNIGEWKSLLKSESFSLRDPTVSMLVATNDPHLRDFVKEKDIYGGFFGRMFIIKEEQVSRLNSLVDDLENPPVPTFLAEYLKILAKLNGPFASISKTVPGILYDEWYNDFYSTVRKQAIEDKTGTIGRFGDSVLKVAMLLSLSERPELSITKRAMEEAIGICEKLISGVRKATDFRGGMAQYADQKALIMQELLNRPERKIARAALLKKYWMHFNSDELDIIMRSFDESGTIKPHSEGNNFIYEMPEHVWTGLHNHLKGKKS
jgi:hypothetical protein